MKIAAFKQYATEKWEHAGFQKYFKNTGWMFFGQLSMIISFIMNIWLARYFGPEKYGAINYTLAFVGLFGFIGNLGIGEILIRDLVRFPEKRNKLLGTSFFLLLGGGMIAFVASCLTALIHEGDQLVKVMILLYSTIFLLSPINVVASYFQSTLQSKKNAWAQIIGVVSVSAFKAFLILSGQGVIWIIFAFILDYVIGFILYVYNYVKSDLRIFDWEFDPEVAKEFLKASFLLMLSSATGYVLLKIDQVMIGYYLDKQAVGIYAAAVKLTEVWYFVPAIISTSIFPAIINAKEFDEALYRGRLKKLFIFLFSIAFLIAIPTTFLAPLIIKIIYGAEYVSSVEILKIYIWSSIGFFLTIGVNKYLIVENKLKSIFMYNTFSAILNVVLNIILIPKIGISGAAWATFISYSLIPIIFLTISKLQHDSK